MRRMMLGALVVSAIGLGSVAPVQAGETSFKKEIEELNRLTGLDPIEGMVVRLGKNPETAKQLLQAALPLAQKQDALNYNAALVLAFAAMQQKDLKSSDVFFHVCAAHAAKAQSTRKLAQSYGGLIDLYFMNKKYADCIRICKEVIELKTDDKTPRIVLRAFTDESGDTDFVESRSFDSAKRLKPMVQRFQVRALAKLGKYPQALKIAEGLIKDEVDWRGRHLKASVQREAGEFAAAAASYEAILKLVEKDSTLDPEERDEVNEELRTELSNIYVDLKDIKKAADQLEILVQKQPEEPGHYNDLGYILADHGVRLEEAEKLIRKALDLDLTKRKKKPGFDPKTDHDNGAYLDSLGWVLFKKKQYAEARKILQQALEDKKAQHIEIYDHLGDACMALGDREAAIRAWEKGLEHVTDARRDQDRRTAVEMKIERAKSKSASK
ncbi:MAG: tetratricopeptide repeat protein [Pseudomonadota bacterium]|nr:tetratricopeptide repeat protein [Pseudomonadota bacterium]